MRLFSNNVVGLYRPYPLLLVESGIRCKGKLLLYVCFCSEFLQFVHKGARDVLSRGYLLGDGFRDDAKKFRDSVPTMKDILYLVAVLNVPKGTCLPFHVDCFISIL